MHEPSALIHGSHSAQGCNVGSGITVHDEEIGSQPRLQTADLVVQADSASSHRSGSRDDIQRAKTGQHQSFQVQLQVAEIDGPRPGVRAGDKPVGEAQIKELAQNIEVGRYTRFGLRQLLLLRARERRRPFRVAARSEPADNVIAEGLDGRTQEHIRFAEEVRHLLIEGCLRWPATTPGGQKLQVLHHVNARSNGPLHPLKPAAVGHDQATETVGFVYKRL